MPNIVSHVILAFSMTILVITGCRNKLDPSDLPALKTQGNRIIQIIDNYKATNNKLPLSLDEAKIDSSLLITKYGSFRYRTIDNDTYELEVGEYHKNYFTLTWNNKTQEWHWDG